MTNQPLLDSVLETVNKCPPESLPRILGLLREIVATAEMRLHSAPAPVQPADEFLSVKAAALKLGCSRDFLYKNRFPFVRRLGRKRLFSARGIEHYLLYGKPQ